MQYAGIIKNDICAGEGVCVSFFTQGCPHKCPGCHNQETWDFSGGKEFTQSVLTEIIDALKANGVHRNFCVMGGEPLCPENRFLTLLVINTVAEKVPEAKIYVWTGYDIETLLEYSDNYLKQIFNKTDVIIDGRYIESERDITLPMRGSRNQRILYKGKDFNIEKKE